MRLLPHNNLTRRGLKREVGCALTPHVSSFNVAFIERSGGRPHGVKGGGIRTPPTQLRGHVRTELQVNDHEAAHLRRVSTALLRQRVALDPFHGTPPPNRAGQRHEAKRSR